MTYDPIIFEQPLEAAKNEIVSKLNVELHIMLSLTDWTIIRREEIGTDLPAGISDYRNALRQQHQTNENLIMAASTIEQLETIANSLDPIYGVQVSAPEVHDHLTMFIPIIEQLRGF